RDLRLAVSADGRAGRVQVRGARARRIGARDARRRRHDPQRHRLADPASRQHLGRVGAARAPRVRARRADPSRPPRADAGRWRRLYLGLVARHAMKLALVFPGQGSQSVGMLQGYAGVPGVAEAVEEARRILGTPFTTLLDQGPAEQLELTVNTQPAMVTGGYAAYTAWRALGGPEPEMVAGHSLGEYTALVVAGALKFADALPLVRFRAQAMQEAVPQGQGAMAAILSLDQEKVRQACGEAGGVVQAVNFNSPEQIVIAGEKA